MKSLKKRVLFCRNRPIIARENVKKPENPRFGPRPSESGGDRRHPEHPQDHHVSCFKAWKS